MPYHIFLPPLQLLLPCLYAAVVVLYAAAFFGDAPRAERFKSRLLVLTIVLHGVYLVMRTLQFDHAPITAVFEIMTVLSWCIAIAYLYIESRTRTGSTGFIILSLAFLFQMISSVFIRDVAEIPEYLHSFVLGFHVSAALLGYTAISLSAAYGVLYLLLYHEIKSSRLGVIYQRLPSLEVLESMSRKAEAFGFAALTVAIMIGVVWLPKVFKDFSYWDPKLIATVVIWVLYAVGLTAKRTLGWQGRRTMVIAIAGFCIVVISMLVINNFLSSFHTFH